MREKIVPFIPKVGGAHITQVETFFLAFSDPKLGVRTLHGCAHYTGFYGSLSTKFLSLWTCCEMEIAKFRSGRWKLVYNRYNVCCYPWLFLTTCNLTLCDIFSLSTLDKKSSDNSKLLITDRIFPGNVEVVGRSWSGTDRLGDTSVTWRSRSRLLPVWHTVWYISGSLLSWCQWMEQK